MEEEGLEAKKVEYAQGFKYGVEAVEAAFLLVSLKNKKLDRNTASALHELKRKFAKERETKLNNLLAKNKQKLNEKTGNALQVLPGSPQLFWPIDDYKPPAIPPVERLSGFITFCSTPFEKQLTVTDMNDGQSRLSMNKDYVENRLLPLLTKDELPLLEKPFEGIPVTTYDKDGNEYPMKFKIWSGKIRVLTTGWVQFCEDHDLKALQDFVSVWMFRHLETGKLCFVITSRRLNVFQLIKKRRRCNSAMDSSN